MSNEKNNNATSSATSDAMRPIANSRKEFDQQFAELNGYPINPNGYIPAINVTIESALCELAPLTGVIFLGFFCQRMLFELSRTPSNLELKRQRKQVRTELAEYRRLAAIDPSMMPHYKTLFEQNKAIARQIRHAIKIGGRIAPVIRAFSWFEILRALYVVAPRYTDDKIQPLYSAERTRDWVFIYAWDRTTATSPSSKNSVIIQNNPRDVSLDMTLYMAASEYRSSGTSRVKPSSKEEKAKRNTEINDMYITCLRLSLVQIAALAHIAISSQDYSAFTLSIRDTFTDIWNDSLRKGPDDDLLFTVYLITSEKDSYAINEYFRVLNIDINNCGSLFMTLPLACALTLKILPQGKVLFSYLLSSIVL